MPSDDRVTAALAVLAPATERFRSALAAAVEQARSRLAGRGADARARAARLRQELGRFADSRVDVERFASLLGDEPAAGAAALQRMQAALDTMEELHARGDALFRVEVPPGGVLVAAVHEALAEAGRAFGAARVFDAALAENTDVEGDGDPLRSFPYRRWSAAERRLAPPLVVRVPVASLRATGLGGVLDVGMKIVLVVEGACQPAPLARLVTPGTLVVQASTADALAAVAATDAPAIGALLPEGAARFVHDPAAGERFWQRLRIEYLPPEPARALAGVTAAQQAEELRHLRELAEPPVGPAAAAPGNGAAAEAAQRGDAPGKPAEDQPADRLAMWLLQRTDLGGLG